MVRLTNLRTMLEVQSLVETTEFYERLGFEVVGSIGEPGGDQWCQVKRDAVALMFTWSPPHDHGDGEMHSHEPRLSGSIYIDVDDVDGLYASLEGRIEGVLGEPTTREHGMREFAVEDPNGYVIIFGMPAG